jgi:hypothetical protein
MQAPRDENDGVSEKGLKIHRLSAGGRWIRTPGPGTKPQDIAAVMAEELRVSVHSFVPTISRCREIRRGDTKAVLRP